MRILLIPNFNPQNKKCHQDFMTNLDYLIGQQGFDIALLESGPSTKVIMENDNLIKFQIECKENDTANIPRLTPSQFNNIYDFLSEFKPDIIHSYDEGSISLIAQFWAIRRKTPFLLSLNEMEQDRSLLTNLLLKIFSSLGFNERFINNFYHNATATIINNEKEKQFLEKLGYKGMIYENINKAEIENVYEELKQRQTQYVTSETFGNLVKLLPGRQLQESMHSILPKKKKGKDQKSLSIKNFIWIGTAIIGSLVTYFTLRGKKQK